MKKKSLIAMFGCLMLLFNGCDLSDSTNTASTNISSSSSSSSTYENEETEFIDANPMYGDVIPLHNLTYLDLFDISNKVEMFLDISDEQLFKLKEDVNENINAETYRIANSMQITITKDKQKYTFIYFNVGFRMKGNTSRKPNYISESGELRELIHYKFSFQETFDDPLLYGEDALSWSNSHAKEEREKRTFLDQEKLDARWYRVPDMTHIKEYYALEMFRAFGIISQLSTVMHLRMKRESGDIDNLGVYYLYEAPDKEMYKRKLQSGDSFINMVSWSNEKNGVFGVENSNYGDMYKCSKGASFAKSTSIGIEDPNHSYIYDIKTNKYTTDHSFLKTVMNTITDGNYDDIAEKVDLEYFAMYEAVSYVLGNPDDSRNNQNNFMVYFRRTDGKMIMIPIDQDHVLGITRGWNPFGDGNISLTPLDMRMSTTGTVEYVQNGNLYLKTFLAEEINETRIKYLENIELIFKSKWVQASHFNEYYEKAFANYGAEKIWKATGALEQFCFGWDGNEIVNGKKSNYSFGDYIYFKSITAGFPIE